jgi:hypothetical protein
MHNSQPGKFEKGSLGRLPKRRKIIAKCRYPLEEGKNLSANFHFSIKSISP